MNSWIYAGIRATVIFACVFCASAKSHADSVTSIDVDAREAPRGIERVHLALPVKPGALTLLYPKWLPGEHAPSGAIGGLSGLKFSSNGKALAWRRDDVDMFAFHLVIPKATATLDVDFEVLAIADAHAPNTLRTSTDDLVIILWHQLVLYPAGTQSDAMQVSARLHLPSGWSFGTALAQTSSHDGITAFKQSSLTKLIDSPVLAGRHFKTIELGGSPAAYLHLAADSAAALAISAATTDHMKQLIQQATTLFGGVHYEEYHFLLTLTDKTDYQGIEHHQSSDDRMAERVLIDDAMWRSSLAATLLPHEYTHSWNGKYRRPVGLATGNYDTPMRGDLLWVYEGLTEYLGMVLSARSGLASMADARDAWADLAAWLETRKGREWRPLVDTALAAQISYDQSQQWRARTRGVDFYDEAAMLWLEADALIRRKSNGTKSLDDFCRAFYGPPSSEPKVVPYDFDAVVKALNGVLVYDWRGFWIERLDRVRARAPLEGLLASGWRLSFADEPSPEQKGNELMSKESTLLYSLGFALKDDGAAISEIVPGSPADDAGIAPDSHLIAVDGRKFSKEVLEDALDAATDGTPRAIELLLEKDDNYHTAMVQYAGKPRYPRLERDDAVADTLTAIMTPRSAPRDRPAHASSDRNGSARSIANP